MLGIDLSGRTTGRTALAVATGNGDGVEVELVRSSGGVRLPKRPELRDLAGVAVDLAAEVVAIDAPLTLPHTWTCERDDCDECFPAHGADPTYTLRDCERFEVWAEATPVRARCRPRCSGRWRSGVGTCAERSSGRALRR